MCVEAHVLRALVLIREPVWLRSNLALGPCRGWAPFRALGLPLAELTLPPLGPLAVGGAVFLCLLLGLGIAVLLRTGESRLSCRGSL